jgi:hypothetical protein
MLYVCIYSCLNLNSVVSCTGTGISEEHLDSFSLLENQLTEKTI